EVVEWLCADELAAVDQEARRAGDTKRFALGHVVIDGLGVLAAVERGPELRHVQAELLSVLLEVRTLNRLLVGEEQVVVLPELALLVCRQRGLTSEGSVLVEVERELRERDADVVRIGLEDLVDRRVDLGTEGALEVAELDDRDLGSL